MGQPLSILDTDSRGGKQFFELHGVVSTPFLRRLVPGEDGRARRMSGYSAGSPIDLHVGDSYRTILSRT